MRDPQLPGGGLLKRSYLLPKDKLLRLKHMSYRLQQFLVEGLVLAFEVEHRYRHGLDFLDGSSRWNSGVLHANILPILPEILFNRPDPKWEPNLIGRWAELKRLANRSIVDVLREFTDPGLPAPYPSFGTFT
jgi:hypothetical protein